MFMKGIITCKIQESIIIFSMWLEVGLGPLAKRGKELKLDHFENTTPLPVATVALGTPSGQLSYSVSYARAVTLWQN
jgi:hypothetical protein